MLSRETHSTKPDNLYLLLLPGPTGNINFSSLFALLKVCLINLLICGDVKSNPGQDTQVIVEQLFYGQAQIAAVVTSIKSNQAVLQAKIDGVESRCAGIESGLSQLSGLDKRVRSLRGKIATLEHALVEISDKMMTLRAGSGKTI